MAKKKQEMQKSKNNSHTNVLNQDKTLLNVISESKNKNGVKLANSVSNDFLKLSPVRIKRKKRKKIVEKMTNGAVIYIRVSSEEQVKGFSLDGQQEVCLNFADRNGYKVIEIFREEGQSAKTTKRDEFQKMMKFCKENKNKVKYVIVYRIDRFTRNMLDLLTEEKALEKLGIEILTATETNEKGYMGKFTRHINGLIAQLDNERRADATKNGMKNGFAKGNWMWRASYGYNNDKNLKTIVPDPVKSKIVKTIFEKYATGCYSQADILLALKKEDVIIKPNHICAILRNPIYCGYIHKPEWYPKPIKGNFEPIVSEELFNKVQDILYGRKPIVAPHDLENESYPLKQFIYCPFCGKSLTGSNSISQRGKKLYQYYACYNKECPSRNKEVSKSKFSISKEVAEKSFTDILNTIAPKDEVVDLFKDIVADVYKEQTHEARTIQSKLQKELDEIENKKDEILDLLMAKVIIKEEYERKFQKLSARENEIKINFQNDDLTSQEFDELISSALNIIQNIGNTWNNGVLKIKKQLQRLIFPNGLNANFQDFQNSLNSIIFKQIGSMKEPDFEMVPPSEFESLSTP